MKFVIGVVVSAVIGVTSAMDTVSTPVKTFLPSRWTTTRAYSPDGSQRIVGYNDGTLQITNLPDTTTGREIMVGQASIGSVVFTTDGNALLVLESDSTLWRVDPQTLVITRCIIDKPLAYQRVCTSSDGAQCVVLSKSDSTLVLWNLVNGTGRPCFSGKKVNLNFTILRFSPNGEHILALTSQDSTLELRSTNNDSLQLQLKLPDTLIAVPLPTFSPDSRQMVIPMHTRPPTHSYALFISCETGTIMNSLPLSTSKKDINLGYYTSEAFAISHDGTKLLAGSYYDFAVFDLEAAKELLSFSYYDQYLHYTAWFSPDDKSVLYNRRMSSPGNDSLVKLDLSTKKAAVLSAQQDPPEMLSFGFSADGPLLIGRYRYESLLSGEMKQWDSLVYLNGTTMDAVLKRKYLKNTGTYALYPTWVYSHDGTLLFERILNNNSEVSVSEMNVYSTGSDGTLIYTRNGGYRQAMVAQDRKHLCFTDTSSIFTVDCSTLDSSAHQISLPAAWRIKSVDTETGRICAFSAVQESPSDSMIYTAGVWDIASGERIHQFVTSRSKGSDKYLDGINAQFLPDGVHVIVTIPGCFDTDSVSAALFDVRTGKRLFTYAGAKNGCETALSPDGKQLLACVDDIGIYCYDALTGTVQRFFKTSCRYHYFHSSPFSFNPSNPRQFIAGQNIWELPEPLAVAAVADKIKQTTIRITSLSRKGITFSSLPQNTPLRMQIIRVDGRVIMQKSLPPALGKNGYIVLDGMSDGTVIVRVDTNGKTMFLQRAAVIGR